VAPGVFTAKADGKGAPAAVASADGVSFNIPVSNPDGTPRPLELGSDGLFVSLFGTGFRFAPDTDIFVSNGAAESVTITIDGVSVPVLFAGPQGQLEGLDQVNFQIPASFTGRGVMNAVVTVNGQAANTVLLHLK
jgi:uncharacterized protein (TIGR03437 family)